MTPITPMTPKQPRRGVVAWAGSGQGFARDLARTAAMALPLSAGMIGFMAIGLTDVMMIGRLGEGALAASALGVNFYFVVLLFGIGIVNAVAPLASQAFGAGDLAGMRRIARQGLWVGGMLSVISVILLQFTESIMLLAGQDAVLAAGAGIYLQTMAFALPFSLIHLAIRSWVNAFGITRPPTLIIFAMIPVNALLDYLLIFGNWGIPRLELWGAGLASALTMAIMLACLISYIHCAPTLRGHRLFRRLWRADPALFRRILLVGIPVGCAWLMEEGMFTATIFMAGLIDPGKLAAYHIAAQIAGVALMIPLGIAQAATIRVGHALGRGDLAGARQAGRAALALALICAGVICLAILNFRPELIALFLDGDAARHGRIIETGAGFLLIVGGLQFFDGLQVAGSGVLRGFNDTTFGVWCSGLCFWPLGVGGGALLAFVFGLGVTGLWWGLTIGLGAAAIANLARFLWRARTAGRAFALIMAGPVADDGPAA